MTLDRTSSFEEIEDLALKQGSKPYLVVCSLLRLALSIASNEVALQQWSIGTSTDMVGQRREILVVVHEK